MPKNSKTWLEERLHYFEKVFIILTWKNLKCRDTDVSVLMYS